MFTIGKLARAAQVSADALRFYEREGLIAPAGRSATHYRLFDGEAITRVRFIRHAQACGFTLPEIRDLLSLKTETAACCADVRVQAVEKKLQLEAKIRAMQSMSDALTQLITDCSGGGEPVAACPILAAFERAVEPNSSAAPDES